MYWYELRIFLMWFKRYFHKTRLIVYEKHLRMKKGLSNITLEVGLE